MIDFENYFKEYLNYFWTKNQQDNDITFEIVNGPTIAYYKQIIDILEYITPKGIPPLGVLLLTISATNYNATSSLDLLQKIFNSILEKNNFQNLELSKSFEFLNNLSQLPDRFKTGEKRKLLFYTIFENSHNKISVKKAQNIINFYKNHETTINDYFHKTDFNYNIFVKDLKILELLNIKFPDTQSIINAVENIPNTNNIQNEINDDLTQNEITTNKPKTFLEDLEENSKTHEVGSLIKRLWSGLKITYYNNSPSDQPLGGISDVSNKGDYSRLLLSEFANEDELFMLRLANNEALFLEREIPPNKDNIKRIFLIDNTIKNWGVPKILAYAISISIAKHPKNFSESEYYLVADYYKRIYLENVENVADNMNILSGSLDASQGIELFFKENIFKINTEVFLISSNKTLNLPQIQNAINNNRDNLSYLMSTNFNGEIETYKFVNKSKKHIQTIYLDLDKLWENKSEIMTIQNNNTPKVHDIPILFPLNKNYSDIILFENNYYRFENGCLYKFQKDFSKGFELIKTNLNYKNGKFTLFKNEKNELIFVYLNFNLVLSFNNLQTDKSFSKSILYAYANYSNLNLCSIKNELYIFVNQNYSKIIVDFDRTKIEIKYGENEEIIKSFEIDNYELQKFKQSYKISKTNKYSVLNDIYSLNLSLNNIILNNYEIINDRFVKLKNLINDTDYTQIVNLYLKKAHEKKHIIEYLQKNTSFSLNQIYEIISKENVLIFENIQKSTAESFKKDIENFGNICYLKNSYIQFKNNSKILMNNGIIVFESNDSKIPTFYIPFIQNKEIAMSTDNEFAGNEYFLPINHHLTKINIDDFKNKYLNPFINNILLYTT